MGKFKRPVDGIFFWIYCIWCVSHLYNCVFRHAANDVKIKTLAEKRKMIVDRFGGSKHFEHSLFVVKSKGRALVLHKDTHFGLYFIMLRRLIVLRKVLVICVTCHEYARMNYADGGEYDIIADSNFWEGIELVVKVKWPIIATRRPGDMRAKPTLHIVYKTTLLAEQRFLEYDFDDEARVRGRAYGGPAYVQGRLVLGYRDDGLFDGQCVLG